MDENTVDRDKNGERKRDESESSNHNFESLTSTSIEDDVFDEKDEGETPGPKDNKGVGALLTRLHRWSALSNGSETREKIKKKVTSVWNNVKYHSHWIVNGYDDYEVDSVVVLLSQFYSMSGKESDRIQSFQLFSIDYLSRLWFTYRSDFIPIPSSSLTTDCGWGCTIRTSQMMIGQALVNLHLGREWRMDEDKKEEGDDLSREEMIHREIISLFLDRIESPLSLHSLLYNKISSSSIGKWFTPSESLHLFKRALSHSSSPLTSGIEMDIIVDGSIDMSSLEMKTANWTRRLIVIVCLRLGLHSINQMYYTHIKHLLQHRTSLGIVGGKTNRSLYFIGYSGEDVIYLDPHVSHTSLSQLDDISSYHCNLLSKMSISSMDPSCAIGFLFSNHMELFDTFKLLNKAGVVDLEEGEGISRRNEYPLFTVFTSKPSLIQSIQSTHDEQRIANNHNFNLL